MAEEGDRLKAVRALFAAIEAGDGAALMALYAENAVQVEHPNRLKPKGDFRGASRMAEDLKRGKALLQSERYELLDAAVEGDRAAVQVKWTGILAVPVATLKPGDEMVCWSGIFLRFEGARIVEQHNYDCFEPF